MAMTDHAEGLVHASATLRGIGKMLTSEKLDVDRLAELMDLNRLVLGELNTIYLTEVTKTD